MWSRSVLEENSDRHAVVVCRHWNNPEITVSVTREKIELVCQLSDFVEALAEEMAHPAKTWTRKGQKDAARAAMLKAVEKIKEASAKVM